MKKKKRQETIRNGRRTLFDDVKSSFLDLGFSLAGEGAGEGSAVFKKYISLGMVFIGAEVTYRFEERTLNFSMLFSHTVGEEDRYDLQRLINYFNCYCTSIGHVGMSPENMDIHYLASINLYGEGMRRTKILETSKSVIRQTAASYTSLLRMMANGMTTGMKQIIEDMQKERQNECG